MPDRKGKQYLANRLYFMNHPVISQYAAVSFGCVVEHCLLTRLYFVGALGYVAQ